MVAFSRIKDHYTMVSSGGRGVLMVVAVVLASVLALILNLALLWAWLLVLLMFHNVICLCSNSLMELSGFNCCSLKGN